MVVAVIENARSCVVAVSRFSGFPFSPHKLSDAFKKSHISPHFALVSVEINILFLEHLHHPFFLPRCQKLIMTTGNWPNMKRPTRSESEPKKASEPRRNTTAMMLRHLHSYSLNMRIVVTWKRRIIVEKKGEMVEKLVFWWHDPFSRAHN